MAKIVNRSQRITTGVMFPRGVYSRVVGFVFPVLAGADQWDVTWVLGQELWLLEAKLVLTASTIGGLVDCNWRIATSTFVPGAGGQVALELDPVVDVRYLTNPYANYRGGDTELSFCMNRHYSGAGRRFAVWAQNNSPGEDIWVIASFQISEG